MIPIEPQEARDVPTLFDSLDRPARRVGPGIAHLPGWLRIDDQAHLVARAREIAAGLAGTPLGMTRPVTAGGQMSVYMLSLGHHWRARPYGYVSEVDGVAVPPLPGEYTQLARAAVAAAAGVAEELEPWAGESYRPEAALVNYYRPDASMGMHVDANEFSTAPIVSLSIGDEAVFRIGGTESPNKPWDEVTLMSGDLIVFGGPARGAYHGVPRIHPHTGPAGTGLKEGRINITIRQVEQ
ncbi:alpha-ketoglutarate-dependent dioxygenase AlkB family protein [Corynebacterium doosanense]|uniref:alpha-ketoglutarate-dependent dioxygenase AlkB family protein n=1 Tax=Corynebacterium doosanense TaxID=1121358 RepID=UPI0003720598|nr:alpha-ketoglutarate-dependent dioxygenase AlkB [Corynebacterium doosanense]